MKAFKKILIGLGILVVLLVVVSFFLPSKIHVERSLIINASQETVYGLVVDLKKWDQWSAWHKMDPNMKVTYADKSEGAGASYSWSSEDSNLGDGTIKIAEAVPYDKITLEMYFGGSPEPSWGGWTFEKTQEGTKATNTMDMDAGMNPFMRWMGTMMDAMVGPQFDKSLNSLKEVAERK
ncbi:SRPBCC family protein [Pseudochryseolinea flava]|uniref:Polyketide cyclase n=1 Tax=Pseudochryseolinea flava TaxID=2059302 RepID=A0A364Y3E1_9BACT|nr:SRPBCC family protein [Pseudochryseolinea flava]RAW00864.1 hypothetical protein DQQ10_11515 [Pseudochryseolinea flava]